ncbi:uncharacterized protein DUF1329 [Panacagrimonas perspica]|uniref:Uncharacterized protein DUF1329 n=1 Tax=Panacagrimonas perspica TaxID=381431 RepID=A0A4R7P519_9GAMM|nr:DUF1329 domain-containing protein [Panacagrimonas perspica]TDU28885.1 uncharacterized protein DUF1329 [Panacagrimonas perspica]THD02288.1 hypothetical protein B1810_15280 [Panacagrimonas perspica]
MRVIRYDRQYSRRKFLRDCAAGILGTGVLCPLAQAIADTGTIEKAYPEELLSIEGFTKGRIKTGDVIDASNVEHVKDLLEPVRYEQLLKLGRRLKTLPTTRDAMRLSPWEYIEATLRNAGKAKFDAKGNVVNAADGEPWIGGNPFPDPKTGLELFAAQTLNWGRHDASTYAFKEFEISGKDGKVRFNYAGVWAEFSPVARVVLEPKPYWPEHKDKLRYQTVCFLSPTSFRGTSFLNIWDYDHSTFPNLYGYVPEFRRVRQFPTTQRFEPLVPGSSLYLSDAWAAGDPLHTWGNYRIVGRGPFLAGLSGNWNPSHPNWECGVHGGAAGQSFWDTSVELIPETIIVEAEPLKFPRAPISKKRVWFDARNNAVVGMLTFDRRGQPYRSFDGAYDLYEKGSDRHMDGAHPYWSWVHVTASDIQTGDITRLNQVRVLEGSHRSGANDPDIYNKYLTQAALIKLGASSA